MIEDAMIEDRIVSFSDSAAIGDPHEPTITETLGGGQSAPDRRRAKDIFRALNDVTLRLPALQDARDEAQDTHTEKMRAFMTKRREVMGSPFFQALSPMEQEYHLEDNLADEQMAVARAEAQFTTLNRRCDKALQQAANLRVLGMMCTIPGMP